MKKYKNLNSAINRESKEIFFNNICQDINEVSKLGLMDKAYGMVKTASIKGANGNIIYEEAEVEKCWKGT